MRTHKQIVQAHGASALVRDLASVGVHVHQSTPQRWADRNNIPGEYWPTLVSLGAASLAELAMGAKPRKRPEPANDAANAGRAA